VPAGRPTQLNETTAGAARASEDRHTFYVLNGNKSSPLSRFTLPQSGAISVLVKRL